MSKEIAGIIKHLSVQEPMKVFEVKVIELDTGSRIEGFTVKIYLFKTYEKALDFAWEVYKYFCENFYEYEHDEEEYTNPQRSHDGCYQGKASGGYDMWPDIQVITNMQTINLDEDCIYKFQHSE
jgi:hypothetical protein